MVGALCGSWKVLGFMPAAFDNAVKATDGDVMEFAPQRLEIADGNRQAPCKDNLGAPSLLIMAICKSAPATLCRRCGPIICGLTDQPGESDITSHVDFEAMAKALGQGGAVVHLRHHPAGISPRHGTGAASCHSFVKGRSEDTRDFGALRCKAGGRARKWVICSKLW